MFETKLANRGLAFADELLADDTCTGSEEGCSLSLRQLRLHKASSSSSSEPVEPEPVSFVLPCTEPSEFESESIRLTELKEEELVNDTNANSDCFLSGVYWREKNRAITMRGTHRTRQSSPEARVFWRVYSALLSTCICTTLPCTALHYHSLVLQLTPRPPTVCPLCPVTAMSGLPSPLR